MATDANKFTLHPAADVVLNRLLLELGKENEQLAQGTTRLDELRNFLGKVELRLGSGRVVQASLSDSFVETSFFKSPSLYASVTGPTPVPFSEFRSGSVTISGRTGRYCGGDFPHGIHAVEVDESSLRLRIGYCPYGIIGGCLYGLSDDDLLCFKNGTYSEENLLDFLRTGRGLQNSALTFIPSSMICCLMDELHGLIRLIGPLQKFESKAGPGGDHISSERLPFDKNVDCIEYPPLCPTSELRSNLVSALECTGSCKLVLQRNIDLQQRHYLLSKIEERISTVEIKYSDLHENAHVSLKDGRSCFDVLWWRISLKGYPIVANCIKELEIGVSGIHSEISLFEIQRADDDRSFVATFSNGAKLFGYFDWGSVASLTMYDFDEIAAGFARNSLQFPPEAKYVATDVYIPFESIQDALRVLGVPILHDIV